MRSQLSRATAWVYVAIDPAPLVQFKSQQQTVEWQAHPGRRIRHFSEEPDGRQDIRTIERGPSNHIVKHVRASPAQSWDSSPVDQLAGTDPNLAASLDFFVLHIAMADTDTGLPASLEFVVLHDENPAASLEFLMLRVAMAAMDGSVTASLEFLVLHEGHLAASISGVHRAARRHGRYGRQRRRISGVPRATRRRGRCGRHGQGPPWPP